VARLSKRVYNQTIYMKSILVQIDEGMYHALNQVAPPKSRRRAQFIRNAVRKAIREAEYARMRRAYGATPDSESEADTWANPEDYRR